jgi:PAS domain S-box-containing protein
MFRLTTLSIRSILLLIIFVVALPAAGIIVYSGIQFRNLLLDDARSETLKLADRIATEQQNLVAGAEQLMTALAQLPEVKGRDAARVEPILRELRKLNPMYSNIIIADLKGIVWATAVPVKPSFVVNDRRYFRNALASGQLSSGEYVVSRATDKPAFNLAYPLKDNNGKIIGVISVGFVIDQYRQQLGRLQFPSGTSFVLSDHQGVVLSRAINPEPYIGKQYPADDFRKMKEGPEAETTIRAGIAGDKRIISYRKMRLAAEKTPYMYVTVGIPVEVAVQKANRALLYNMTLLTSFLVLACIGAVLIGKCSIVDRFRVLENASRRLAAGELHVRVSDLVVGGELGNLGQTFDAMADELARREAERDRLVSILETTTDVVSMATPEGKIIYLNRAGRELTGIGEQPVSDVLIPQIHPKWAAELIMKEGITTAIREGTWEGETALLDGNGLEVPVSQVILSHRDAQGNQSYISTIMRDISERKQAEDALKERKFFFKESQRSASIGSYKADFIADNWESSEVLDTIFGIDRNYVRSIQGWLDIVHPNDRDMMDQYVREEVISQRKPFSKEYRIIRKNDGETRWVNGLGEVKFDSNGNSLSLFGTIQDITERKHAEEEKARLEAQLRQAQKMESVGRLAGGVAHDFNNMLGVILGHAELALMKIDPAHPLHANLEEIRKAAERSADLTRQLLAFARKQTVAPKVLDLNETVAGMLNMLQRLIGEDIHLNWQPGADLWPVKVDPSQIDQIMANLCVNARDAISGVGKITIETGNSALDEDYCAHHTGSVPGKYVLLTMSDDGCGMDKETLSHLFEPFFTTKGMGKGTGLGLATVYGIVKQNSGYINIDSEPGQGTTFTIYLPRNTDKSEQAWTEGAAEPNLRGHETILLVEDEPTILELTTEMLTTQGYTVLAASTPGEAIRLAREHAGKIHLLLTDVVMPEMNGRDLANNLLSLYPHLKRLFMSGYTADVISNHGVLDEGVNFIQKPFSMQALAAKVRKVLDSK